MTFFIAAYDTEQEACLAGCRKIVDVHHQYGVPATFFITGQTLAANPSEYHALLDDPLFEVASHTYSHQMLRTQPYCGEAVVGDALEQEIFRGKQIVEEVFRRPCRGLRPGCGFADGLHGASDVLRTVIQAGYEYVSSQLLGPDYTLPAPLNQPHTYASDGYPDLWELPGHGWHDNVLKGLDRGIPRRMLLWPPALPEAIPSGIIQTPDEEFAINRVYLDAAQQQELEFISLVWHPWSLNQFDPAMQMLHRTFQYVQEQNLGTATYGQLLDSRRAKHLMA
jgi:peptidoglycan/xylan/chitin deacetylase (PgdA/CDA1 family)